MKKIFFIFFCSVLIFIVCYSWSRNCYSEIHGHVTQYHFKNYTVNIKTNLKSEIEILKGHKKVVSFFASDGIFSNLDAMHLNDDSALDFLYSYYFEEYFTLGVLVSNNEGVIYQELEIKDVFQTGLYCTDIKSEDQKNLKTFILKDVNQDGKKDVLLNVLIKNGVIVHVPHCSETILFDDLKKIIESKSKSFKKIQ